MLVEGRVDLTDDLEQLRTATGRVGARYIGADRAEEFAARNGVPGGLVVRLHHETITGAVDLTTRNNVAGPVGDRSRR